VFFQSFIYSKFLKPFSSILPLLLLIITNASAQPGVQILSVNQYDYTGGAGSTAEVTPIIVSGQPFIQGYRIAVSGMSAKIGDSILRWQTTQDIDYGDVIQISFWVRKIAPLDGNSLRAFVSFEAVAASFARSLFAPFPCDNDEWVRYSFRFKAAGFYAAGEAQVTFQFAHSPQTFEIGGLDAVNLGPTPAPTKSGVPVISNDIFRNYVSYIDPKVGGSVRPVDASGPSFVQAFQIATNGDSDFIYRSGLSLSNVIAINKGDLMLLTFWARKIEPAGESVINAKAAF
jgi:hypothetical protein